MDDTGDGTANGTPHAGAIFAAMNRHAIACGGAGDATNQNSAECGAAIGQPTVAGQWVPTRYPRLDAAANAANYEVYRNEISCDSSFTRVGTVAAPTLTYADNTVVGASPTTTGPGGGANQACMAR